MDLSVNDLFRTIERFEYLTKPFEVIELLARNPGQENLYCYGADSPMGGDIELTGNLYCDFGDVEGLSSGPEWIEFDRFCDLRAPDWNIHDGISLRIWGQRCLCRMRQ